MTSLNYTGLHRVGRPAIVYHGTAANEWWMNVRYFLDFTALRRLGNPKLKII